MKQNEYWKVLIYNKAEKIIKSNAYHWSMFNVYLDGQYKTYKRISKSRHHFMILLF
jgi:hypothetical protein